MTKERMTDVEIWKKVLYALAGSLLGCSILVLLYFYFPSGFRAAIIGVPLFLYSHFYGSNPETKAPVTPSETAAVENGISPLQPAAGSEKTLLSQGPASSDAKKSATAVASVHADSRKAEASAVAPTNDQPVEARMFSPGARAMAAAMKARAGQKGSGAKEFLVLYGSQTGNAMEIAKSISAEAVAQGIASRAVAMSETSLTKLQSVQVALFVVSSTGDGDPPENAESLFNAIRRKTHAADMLAGLRYSVLGLGDSNFTRFMHVPRAFSTRLPDLGATVFYKCCEADEVDGLEDIVEAWQAGLWAPLRAAMEAAPAGDTAPSKSAVTTATSAFAVEEEEAKLVGVPALQPCRVKLVWMEEEANPIPEDNVSDTSGVSDSKDAGSSGGYSHSKPLWAPVSESKYLTAEWSDREVIHLELDIKGSGIRFEAGDSIGVVPRNCPETVGKLLERLDSRGGTLFTIEGLEGGGAVLGHIKQPCSLEQAFSRYVDITAVPKKGLLRMLGEYCSDPKQQRQLFHWASRGGKEAYKTDIQDGRPGLVDLLQRFPSCKPDLGHLLDTLPPLVPRFYSITNAPSPTHQPERVQVAFSVVKGGGGGGDRWLFFGCRREEEDFLYREELEGFVVEKVLSHLVVALSRAQEQKVYVQDKVREHGAALGKLLMDPKAYVYVCGDGGVMAKDVHAALVAIVADHMGKKESLAIAHLSAMMTQKRYIRDIWS